MVRQSPLAVRGATGGTTTTAEPRTGPDTIVMSVWSDGLDCCCSDVAQQESACSCEITRCWAETCDSPLCMGHVSASRQQDMRASGVAAHPAHRVTLPATIIRLRARAGRRCSTATATQGCRREGGVSIGLTLLPPRAVAVRRSVRTWEQFLLSPAGRGPAQGVELPLQGQLVKGFQPKAGEDLDARVEFPECPVEGSNPVFV